MEQNFRRMVAAMMNRGSELRIVCMAVAAACWPAAGSAKDDPHPSLSVDPIYASSLLAPVEEAAAAPSYRLTPGGDYADGQRAKLSIDVGKATMYAITGRLQRRAPSIGPLDSSHAGVLGPRRESGKVYGAGVSSRFRGVDLSATYQYSKLRSEQGESDSIGGGPGRSHSLRATARIKFGR
jgi:hypothetical protein